MAEVTEVCDSPQPELEPESKPEPEIYRIGYAFPPQKVESFIGTTLVDYAKQQGIDLVPIDLTKPLAQQGTFHCVLHKLHPQDWAALDLAQYQAQNPNAVLIDPPHMLDRIRDRSSMLDAVNDLKLPLPNVVVTVPNQVLVKTNDEMEKLTSPLHFPLIAKPLFADGSEHSHELLLVFDDEGIATLNAPVVLQEFVNHGGVMFKVYAAGEHVTCVKRRSLPDITEEKAKSLKGTVLFSKISYSSVQEECDNGDAVSDIEKAEMPPLEFITEFGKVLREAMGINLFNVDVIRDVKDPNRYFVIDVNYFPGYAKLPCFEQFITSFLLDSVRKKIVA